jgi:plasmid stabilization system protein ParE
MEKSISIRWTEGALSDLREIYDFLVETISINYAEDMIDKIYQKPTVLISGYLYMGQREPALLNRKLEYRYLIETHYKIIYSVENEEIVIIHVVFDTRQHPEKLGKKL